MFGYSPGVRVSFDLGHIERLNSLEKLGPLLGYLPLGYSLVNTSVGNNPHLIHCDDFPIETNIFPVFAPAVAGLKGDGHIAGLVLVTHQGFGVRDVSSETFVPRMVGRIYKYNIQHKQINR